MKTDNLYEIYETIVAFLTAHGIPFTIHEHIPSYTVADAGERLPFPAKRLPTAIKPYSAVFLKSALFSWFHLAAAIGTKRADVVRLTPEEVTDIFGVEIGSVSPIALQRGVEVLFDTQVPTHETVFCGIGRADRTLEIQLMDLVQITHGRILSLINDER